MFIEMSQGEMRRIAEAINQQGEFFPRKLPRPPQFLNEFGIRVRGEVTRLDQRMHLSKSVAGLVGRLHRPLR